MSERRERNPGRGNKDEQEAQPENFHNEDQLYAPQSNDSKTIVKGVNVQVSNIHPPHQATKSQLFKLIKQVSEIHLFKNNTT